MSCARGRAGVSPGADLSETMPAPVGLFGRDGRIHPAKAQPNDAGLAQVLTSCCRRTAARAGGTRSALRPQGMTNLPSFSAAGNLLPFELRADAAP